jgi:hypothetical protein
MITRAIQPRPEVTLGTKAPSVKVREAPPKAQANPEIRSAAMCIPRTLMPSAREASGSWPTARSRMPNGRR